MFVSVCLFWVDVFVSVIHMSVCVLFVIIGVVLCV